MCKRYFGDTPSQLRDPATLLDETDKISYLYRRIIISTNNEHYRAEAK